MTQSIIQKDKTHCFICNRNKNADYGGLDEHHVFGGYGKRDLSETYGLKVYLCHDQCHLNGVHKYADLNKTLQQTVQRRAMDVYNWTEEDFINIFGKSYL